MFPGKFIRPPYPSKVTVQPLPVGAAIGRPPEAGTFEIDNCQLKIENFGIFQFYELENEFEIIPGRR